MKPKPLGTAQPSIAKLERAAAAQAYDAMRAARPLKPPPYNFGPVQISAAALALRADQKAGIV